MTPIEALDSSSLGFQNREYLSITVCKSTCLVVRLAERIAKELMMLHPQNESEDSRHNMTMLLLDTGRFVNINLSGITLIKSETAQLPQYLWTVLENMRYCGGKFYSNKRSKLLNACSCLQEGEECCLIDNTDFHPSTTEWCWKTLVHGSSDKNLRYFLCNANINKVRALDTKCHETVCHVVVSTCNSAIPLVRILASRVPNMFTQPDNKGNVPLHNAVERGSDEIVRVLVDICAAAVKVKNIDGESPVHCALCLRQFSILETMLDAAIIQEPDCPGIVQLLESLLIRAMQNHTIEYIPLLFKLQSQYGLTVNFNCTDSNGHTPWFFLQTDCHIQKEVEMMFNRSKVEPDMKDIVRRQLSVNGYCKPNENLLKHLPVIIEVVSTGTPNDCSDDSDDKLSDNETLLSLTEEQQKFTQEEVPSISTSVSDSNSVPDGTQGSNNIDQSPLMLEPTTHDLSQNQPEQTQDSPSTHSAPAFDCFLSNSMGPLSVLLPPSAFMDGSAAEFHPTSTSASKLLPPSAFLFGSIAHQSIDKMTDEVQNGNSKSEDMKSDLSQSNVEPSPVHSELVVPKIPLIFLESLYAYTSQDSSADDEADYEPMNRKKRKRKCKKLGRPSSVSFRLRSIGTGSSSDRSDVSVSSSDTSVESLKNKRPIHKPLKLTTQQKMTRRRSKRWVLSHRRTTSESEIEKLKPLCISTTATDNTLEEEEIRGNAVADKNSSSALCIHQLEHCVRVHWEDFTSSDSTPFKSSLICRVPNTYFDISSLGLIVMNGMMLDVDFCVQRLNQCDTFSPVYCVSKESCYIVLEQCSKLQQCLHSDCFNHWSIWEVLCQVNCVKNSTAIAGNPTIQLSSDCWCVLTSCIKIQQCPQQQDSLDSKLYVMPASMNGSDALHHFFHVVIYMTHDLCMQELDKNGNTASPKHCISIESSYSALEQCSKLQQSHGSKYQSIREVLSRNNLPKVFFVTAGAFVVGGTTQFYSDCLLFNPCSIEGLNYPLMNAQQYPHRQYSQVFADSGLNVTDNLPRTTLIGAIMCGSTSPDVLYVEDVLGYEKIGDIPGQLSSVEVSTNEADKIQCKDVAEKNCTSALCISLMDDAVCMAYQTPLNTPDTYTPSLKHLDVFSFGQLACIFLVTEFGCINMERDADSPAYYVEKERTCTVLPQCNKLQQCLHNDCSKHRSIQEVLSRVNLPKHTNNALETSTETTKGTWSGSSSPTEAFVLWVEDFIQEYGYEKLRESIPEQYHFLLGLSEWKGQFLSQCLKKRFPIILDMIRRNKSAFPCYATRNLNCLLRIVSTDVSRSEPRVSYRRGGEKANRSRSVRQKVKTKQPSATKVEQPALNQPSSGDHGVLGFASNNQPLEVIRSHLTMYSKCCPRHDIQNIVVIGTTVPASDAFGPKRRYSSIKDLKDDMRHSLFNSSTTLKAHSDLKHLSCSTQQVMSDKTMVTAVSRDKRAEPMVESSSSARQSLASLQPVCYSQGNCNVEMQNVNTLRRHDEANILDPSITGRMHRSAKALYKAPTLTEKQKSRAECDTVRSVEAPLHPDPYVEDEENTSESKSNAMRNVAASIHHTSHHKLTGEELEHKETLKILAELLHAQDYARILPLSYDGQPPEYLPPETRIPYVFITGLAYYKMSSHKKSVQYFHQCLVLAEQCERDGDVTICNIYIGDIDFAQRKYTEAAGRYQTALHFYSRDSVAKDFRMILPTKSAVWSKCGAAFKNASRVGDSVAAYEQAIEIASSRKDKLSAHTSLGNLFQGIGENDRAVKEYEEAIELAKELDDDVSLGWNHGNLGNALLGLQQRDKALHHLFKALDMAVDYETTPTAIGRAYNNLGTAFQSLSELVKAEEYYDLALAQAIYGNDISGQARVYGNIGNLQMLNKQYDRAVPHYTEVMRLSNDRATITTAHHNRGCAYYDWAEKKKMNAIVRASNKASTGFKVSLHGPDFERCEEVYRPLIVLESVQKYYLQGTRDLDYVIKHHEETFSGIKGSPKGLSLSVSLFETNSRTFHRMQDCLIHLQRSEDQPSRFEDALLVAEQSRARTLGELLLKRRGPQLRKELVSPSTSTQQLKDIVKRQNCPVVYLSYTGERLLGWLLYPFSGRCSINMFEVPLGDNEFDGKSFDYHLRYSLNEQLVEKSFEMYKPFDYDKAKTEPVEKLYDLVPRPLMTMLEKLDCHQTEDDPKSTNKARKVIIIPDSYTNLLPFTCTLDKTSGKFWGDKYYFQIMPSLLTMGILDQLPTVSVAIPVQYQQMLCVVGNPTIPRFTYNNEEWDLGKLPHATKEAEWVSHILKCTPILHEQATKEAVLMRVMNAKVIHLATHGSAVAGFLAFAGMAASSSKTVDAKKVLIYPEDIESLNISPALVVLSSCDSGRGVFKADGIQGMARAFILAGAQAVLTTLWRVPDESACIFMQFFYQYLVDGVCGTEALHKAILSLRCFSKYSQYIHWSGYQLTGREFQFDVNYSSMSEDLNARLGCSSVFPRLDIVKQLQETFLNDPRLPTDVQVILM